MLLCWCTAICNFVSRCQIMWPHNTWLTVCEMLSINSGEKAGKKKNRLKLLQSTFPLTNAYPKPIYACLWQASDPSLDGFGHSTGWVHSSLCSVDKWKANAFRSILCHERGPWVCERGGGIVGIGQWSHWLIIPVPLLTFC